MGKRLWALMRKEFVQLRRDKRTLAMLIFLPVLWLVAFGFAVNFDIDELNVAFVDEAGNESSEIIRDHLQTDEHFQLVDEIWNRSEAEEALKNGEADVVIIVPSGYELLSVDEGEAIQPNVLVDGSQLFSAQSGVRYFQEVWVDVQQDRLQEIKADMERSLEETNGEMELDFADIPQFEQLARVLPPEELAAFQENFQSHLQGQIEQNLQSRADDLLERFPDVSTAQPEVDVLYNPDMRTIDFMIPGLVGLVLIFITTLMTALGIVKERERGTLEQLVVSPLSSFELMLGKVLPYVVIALVDFLIVFMVGIWLFDVPFKGSFLPFFAVSLTFLVCSLGIGLLVSTVSNTQQQAMQLAIFTLVPQFILSGFVFPLEAMPWGIRWVAYLMPLTYYVPISRGVFLKGADVMAYVQPTLILSAFAVLLLLAATLRFRRKLG